MDLKFPPVDRDNDVCLVMMVPSRHYQVHPAIRNAYHHLKIWVPPGDNKFQEDVQRYNDTARVVATEVDLRGCRELLKGML